MQLGELLSSLLVNLQSLMKTEVNLGRASFPKIIAIILGNEALPRLTSVFIRDCRFTRRELNNSPNCIFV